MIRAIARSYDVVIVGGGPAGLSAGLILARCSRRILVCDSGRHRNDRSRAMHGFLSRDGIQPRRFLELARAQLCKYPTVDCLGEEIVDVSRDESSFLVTSALGVTVRSRRLLLATGVVDELPAIAGIDRLYGRSVFHCPYCDGWEARDAPIVVYGPAQKAAELAVELSIWSRDIVVSRSDESDISGATQRRIRQLGIRTSGGRIATLRAKGTKLERVAFDDGSSVRAQTLFFCTRPKQQSELPKRLGCSFTDDGLVMTSEFRATRVPGLYVAGNASRGLQLAIVAASEGAQAGFAINEDLSAEHFDAATVGT